MNVDQITSAYDAGHITRMEQHIRLCELAADSQPSQLATLIQPELLATLCHFVKEYMGPRRLTGGDEQRFNLGLAKWRNHFSAAE